MYNCVDCGYLDIRVFDMGRYKCVKKYEYHYGDDLECYSFCHHKYSSDDVIRYRSDSMKKEAISRSKGYREGGCYITTMLVNILGLDDNDIVMDTMRDFRTQILQKNDKYKKLLFDYDIMGPSIAVSLLNDKNSKKVSGNFFKGFIIPIVFDIKSKEYEAAIVKYANMTDIMRLYYCIDDVCYDGSYENYDINKMGYGKVRKYIKI